jgi:hypothetical protein
VNITRRQPGLSPRRVALCLLAALATGCADADDTWARAQELAQTAQRVQAGAGYAHPLWVDVGRECSRVMPWQEGFAEARALRAEIEAGRLEAVPDPLPRSPLEQEDGW